MITPSFSLTATERVLPNLALDFTTASLDPRVTFTRTTDATHPATYVNSSGIVTAATNNQPRFDYTLNSGGSCKGLLIEESRTNILLQSADTSNVAWTATNITRNANSAIAPDGTLTAAKLTITNTASNNLYQYPLSGPYANQYLTVSFYAKADSAMTLRSHLTDGVAGQFFNSSLTTTWQRFTYTMLQAAGSPGSGFFISLNTNSTTPFYVWGAQMELGAFATSYIPTTTTVLTRNADVATMTGTNFSSWYNQTQGTFVATFDTYVNNAAGRIWWVDDGSINNCIFTTVNATTTVGISGLSGGVFGGSLSTGAVSANTKSTVVGAYSSTTTEKISLNGGTTATGSVTLPLSGINRAYLGTQQASSSFTNGHLYKMSYYSQALTAAEVQAFSKG